jgi:hypothetical protein
MEPRDFRAQNKCRTKAEAPQKLVAEQTLDIHALKATLGQRVGFIARCEAVELVLHWRDVTIAALYDRRHLSRVTDPFACRLTHGKLLNCRREPTNRERIKGFCVETWSTRAPR